MNSWYFAPCLTGTGIGDTTTKIDFTVSCKIDGTDVPINMGADAYGKTWWPEGTGSLSGSDCIRLAGGYNEWATKYIDEPGAFTTIEYTITLNSTDPALPTTPDSTDTPSDPVLDNQPKTAENPAIAVYAGLSVLAMFAVVALVLNRKQIL